MVTLVVYVVALVTTLVAARGGYWSDESERSMGLNALECPVHSVHVVSELACGG